MKKSMCSALLAVVCCLPVVGTAAICRSGQAASVGSQAGYEQAKQASDVWAERERSVSDELEDCLARIRTTNISLPSFPSLQGIMDQIADQICQAVVDKVNSHIPSSFDPWQQYQNY
ncbi:conjugal transfer protein [Pseudomonas sp. DC3000-4b1]|uniref:conjugal transfer protein n=1 Tax=unclassified Pseudomonas TaxID=196821 RepID=UPI003CE9386A